MKRKTYEIVKDIFEENNHGKAIILYGAGNIGTEVLDFLRAKDVSVSYFCDKKLGGSEVCGLNVIFPDDLRALAGDGDVVIISCRDYNGVAERLSEIGGEYDVIGYTTLLRLHDNSTDGDYLPGATAIQKTLAWFQKNTAQGGGILYHDLSVDAYPECTGYIIPTLIDCGFRDFAVKLGKWLQSVMTPDGGIIGANSDRVFLFDTAQVLRGFNALCKIGEDFSEEAKRTADCIYQGMIDGGKGGFIHQYDNYGSGTIPESIMLYALPPLIEFGKMFDIPEYVEAVKECVGFYKNSNNFLKTTTLTHFLAYQLEALIDLGFAELAVPTLEVLKTRQHNDGSITAFDGVNWVCVPGLAQLAICWYKLGDFNPADKAMSWLDSIQNRSGGFYGSVGLGATYFPENEICWSAKFYADAYRLRIKSSFDREANNFPADIDEMDGRMTAVVNKLSCLDVKLVVVEAGCGRGRFLKGLLDKFPKHKYVGVDISDGMLALLPEHVEGKRGNLENIPLSTSCADFVFSIEAVEHSVNINAAVYEMARICKSGGRIVIIDKQKKDWGRFKCPEWERWPDKDELTALLKEFCTDVTVYPVAYGNSAKGDELMLAWEGIKR